MQNFFTPKSIAVIGVSKDTNKVGHVIFKNLYQKFKTYPIHPLETSILGQKVYSSIEKVQGKIDLAIIAIPAPFVIHAVNECGKKGVKHIILVTSGFKEIGNTHLEYELSKALEHYDIKCVGPNCLGVFDAHSGLDSLFLPIRKMNRPKAGGISFISQSGAVGSAVLDLLAEESLGFAKFISYGNAANLSETDFLEYLGKDTQTKVICMYIEGIHDGKKFLRIAKNIKKPIILIKGGKSQRGAHATLSHTGSLAGSYEIYKGACTQAGIIVADSLEEVFHIAKLFVMLPKPKGNRVQVITNGGGYGILTIDELETQKIPLADMTPKTRAFLKHHVPKIVSISNPMDLVGDATNERYGLALKMCVDDKNIDVIVLIILHQTPLIDENIINLVAAHKGKKPIIVLSVGGKQTAILSKKMEAQHIPVFAFPKDAVSALKKWYTFFNV